MVCIRRETVASQFCVNVCTAGFSMLKFLYEGLVPCIYNGLRDANLKDKYTSALANDKTTSVFVKGSGS